MFTRTSRAPQASIACGREEMKHNRDVTINSYNSTKSMNLVLLYLDSYPYICGWANVNSRPSSWIRRRPRKRRRQRSWSPSHRTPRSARIRITNSPFSYMFMLISFWQKIKKPWHEQNVYHEFHACIWHDICMMNCTLFGSSHSINQRMRKQLIMVVHSYI